MSVQRQRMLAIGVLVATAMIGAINVAGPESLGIPVVTARWLGILLGGLATLQGFLPRIQGAPSDPDTLADHMWDLSDADRLKVTRKLEAYAAAERALTVEAKP